MNIRYFTCLWCDAWFRSGSPAQNKADAKAHTGACEKHPLRAEVETLKRERDEAAARVLDVAQLAGISYEAECVASAPGPHEVILETLREWKHANNLKFDCDALIAERDRYRAVLQEIVDGATSETAPAANIARKALEGETK